MTELSPGARWASPAMQEHLRRRHRAERRFRRAGVIAIGLALLGLVTPLASIAVNGFSAFRATEIGLDVFFDPALFPGSLADAPYEQRASALAQVDYGAVLRNALESRFTAGDHRS